MTVEVYAIMYNEEYVLPHFLKHYQNNFNAKITVFDNHSTDNSRQIALDHGCTVKTFDTQGKINEAWYLNIKNQAWKNSKADFVMVIDIDEFLELPFDLDINRFTILNTLGYDMIGEPSSRMGVHNGMFNKKVCFSPKHVKEINYIPGCHTCNPVGNLIYSSPATLLHRKYISEEYVLKKHNEYESRLSAFNKERGYGVHYENNTIQSVKEKFEYLWKNAKLIP